MNEALASQVSLEDRVVAMKNNIEILRRALGEARKKASRYDVLRGLEVIIMSPEGPRYLRNDELDAYVDSLAENHIGVYAQEVAQAIPQAVTSS